MQPTTPIPALGIHDLAKYTQDNLKEAEIGQYWLVASELSGDISHTHHFEGAWRSFNKPTDEDPDYRITAGYQISTPSGQWGVQHQVLITPDRIVHLETLVKPPNQPFMDLKSIPTIEARVVLQPRKPYP